VALAARPRGRARGRLRLLLGLAVLAAALALLGLGLFPQAPLRRLAEDRLRGVLGPAAEVHVGGLRLSPLRLSLEVSDVRIRRASFALELPRGALRLAPSSLLGPLRVTRLELERPALSVTLPAAPSSNAPVPAAAALALPAEVSGLSVREARLRVVTAAGALALDGVAASGALGSGALELSGGGGSWSGEPAASLGPWRARLAVSTRLDLELLDSRIEVEGSRVRARGAVLRAGAPRPDLTLAGELDLARLSRLAMRAGTAPGSVATQAAADGVVALRATLRDPAGPREASRLRAEAELSGARLGVAGIAVGRMRATGHWNAAGAEGGLRLSLHALGGVAEGRAELARGRISGSASLRGLELSRLPGVAGSPLSGASELTLELSGDVSRGVELRAHGASQVLWAEAAGTLVVDASGAFAPRTRSLDATWTLRAEGALPEGARLEADARGSASGALPPRVEGTLAATVAAPTSARRAELTGTFVTEGARHAAELRAALLGGTLRLEASIEGADLRRAELRGEGLDLGVLGAGLAGTARLEASAAGSLVNPRVAGTSAIDGLGWRGASLGRLDVTLAGDVERPEIAAALPDLNARAQLALPSARPGRAVAHDRARRPAPSKEARLEHASRTLVGRLELDATPLQPLAPLLPAQGREQAPLGGSVTASAEFELPLARPAAGSASLAVAAFEARRGRLAVSASPFRVSLAEGSIAIEDAVVRGPGVSLTAGGRVTLPAARQRTADGTALDLRLGIEADLGGVPAPEAVTLAGTVQGELAVGGTVQSPRVQGALRLADVVAGGPKLARTALRAGAIRFEGDRASTSGLRLETMGGHATLEGTLPFAAIAKALRAGPLRPEDEARLRLAWEGLSVEALGASLAGVAELAGGLGGLDEPRLTVTLPETPLSVQDLALTLEPATLRLAGGRLTVQDLTLRSESAALTVSGRVDLPRRVVEGEARGSLDLRALSPFAGDAALRGRAELDLTLSGPLEAPRPGGTLRVHEGAMRLRLLPQALSGLEGVVSFEGGAARLTAEGRFGGGRVALEGTASLSAPRELRLGLTGRDLSLEYPPGLRTRLEADLGLGGPLGALRLTGDVRVLRGVYDLDQALQEAARTVTVEAAESPALRSVALDVRLLVAKPVLVRGDLAQLEATGELAVRGDLQEPAPFGRFEVRPGGTVVVQGRDFKVESASLAYAGNLDPAVSLAAVAEIPVAQDTTYSVRVNAAGRLESPGVTLSSTPALSEGQIVALIATGNPESSTAESSKWLVGGQAATLFTGRLGRGLAAGFGLDEISFRPDLVARETDPGARVTFGKRLGRGLRLIYSVGLAGAEARYLQLGAEPGRDVQLTFQRYDDGLLSWGAGQRFRFGAAQRPGREREERTRLDAVRFEGELGLPEAELREAVRARGGRHATPWSLQRDADRLREALRAARHLEAEASARLEGASAVFEVRAGPRFSWRVEGLAPAPSLEREVREALFEEEALERGRARLLRELRGRGHLRAEVEARGRAEDAGRVLVFEVRPGPLLDVAEVRFPGAAALGASELLAAAGGPQAVAADPEAARRALEAAYRARLHLGASVGVPRVLEAPEGQVVELPVVEGPRARLAGVRFEGATLPEAQLQAAAALRPGEAYDEAAVRAAGLRVRDLYLARGYPYARVVPARLQEGPDLVAVLRVVEGEALAVGPIEIAGATRTRLGLVRRQLGLAPGEPLDPRRLAEAERRLLDLGTFSRASVRFEAIGEPERGPRPARIRVELEEDANRVAAYDVRWNDDERLSGLLDGELRNLMGTGLALGGRFRLGADVRELRGSLHLPGPFAGAGFTGSVTSFEEDLDLEGIPVVRRQRGFQVQESLRLPASLRLLVGYRYRRETTIVPDFVSDPIAIAGAELSLVQDTRDSLLDATRGRFLSMSLELAPTVLGTDAPFAKGFAQALLAHPIRESRFTWAHGYRVGLGWGLEGQPLLPTERFRAGGPASLRGFGTDEVGPRSVVDDEPVGGEAALVLNQELRWRAASGFGAAAFYDAGNVFTTVREMRFDLRHSLGVGLRWASPVGLLRFDVGFPLGRREGEKRFRLFFGLGQAF
jgi:outer membrane protein assembly factor BamA